MVRRIKPINLNFVAICMQYHTMKKNKWRGREKMTDRSRGTDIRIVACEQSIIIGVFGASVSSSARNYVALSSASRLEVSGVAVNLYPTRLKSPRGKRNARLAELIMRAWSQGYPYY